MPTVFRWVVISLLVLIVTQLAYSLYHLWQGKRASMKTAAGLRARILTALLLVFILFYGSFQGWLEPHALPLWSSSTPNAEKPVKY